MPIEPTAAPIIESPLFTSLTPRDTSPEAATEAPRATIDEPADPAVEAFWNDVLGSLLSS